MAGILKSNISNILKYRKGGNISNCKRTDLKVGHYMGGHFARGGSAALAGVVYTNGVSGANEMSAKSKNMKLYEEAAYGVSEAAAYLKVPYNTLRYWLTGYKQRPAVVESVESDPVRLSFMNLLECHALAGMRKLYDLKLPKVRAALVRVGEKTGKPHPLVTQVFLTDRKDLFVEEMGKIINVSKSQAQMGFDFYTKFLERVETGPEGTIKFFPFVVGPNLREPKTIEINPLISFGKPVITGTGISTAIIVSRFNARESVKDLAEEYGCTPEQIEEAIRWERAIPVAA